MFCLLPPSSPVLSPYLLKESRTQICVLPQSQPGTGSTTTSVHPTSALPYPTDTPACSMDEPVPRLRSRLEYRVGPVARDVDPYVAQDVDGDEVVPGMGDEVPEGTVDPPVERLVVGVDEVQ